MALKYGPDQMDTGCHGIEELLELAWEIVILLERVLKKQKLTLNLPPLEKQKNREHFERLSEDKSTDLNCWY